MTHELTLRRIAKATHDTYHLTFDRPERFSFEPGQSVEMTVLKDGWRGEGRPFTPISLPDEDSLEFLIKSYPSHDGVTEQIAGLSEGDGVSIDEPFGDMRDRGPGVFIAGGAGITPIIALLRKRLRDQGDLAGSTLVFSNKSESDIIWRDKLSAMPGLTVAYTVTDDQGDTVPQRELDRDYLRQFIEPGTLCYLCGPPPMMDAVQSAVGQLGVEPEDLVADDWS